MEFLEAFLNSSFIRPFLPVLTVSARAARSDNERVGAPYRDGAFWCCPAHAGSSAQQNGHRAAAAPRSSGSKGPSGLRSRFSASPLPKENVMVELGDRSEVQSPHSKTPCAVETGALTSRGVDSVQNLFRHKGSTCARFSQRTRTSASTSRSPFPCPE